VEDVAAVHIPEQLSPAIAPPRRHVEAVLAQSLHEVGPDGRAALAWQWALTGTRPSPVTLSLAPGRPPSREEILAEAAAEPEGSTAPPGVSTDFCDQLRETRAILAWLAGGTDELPVDDDNRGRLIGARGDYARTDDDIRQTLDHALLGLKAFDLLEPMSPRLVQLIRSGIVVDAAEGLVEVSAQRVGCGDLLVSGLDLDGAVAAGSADEIPDGPAAPVLDPAADGQGGELVALVVVDRPACRSCLDMRNDFSITNSRW
jgi:hypothetical protein